MAEHVVLAAAAHPDDIEFMMAGTLLLLGQAGAKLHMWHLANGSCGTMRHSREEIVRIRGEEARASAKLAGATAHGPLFDDGAIFYDQASLAKVAAVVREVKPTIVLTQSPQDYMEDHQNTCRLLVTAAFVRGMPNFPTEPGRAPYGAEVAVYHALPHGLRDGMRQEVRPDRVVDIGGVLEKKRDMLACHRSQKEWLDVSQGMDAYLSEMEKMSAEVGKGAEVKYGEGWRRHSHLGFGAEGFDPMRELLGKLCYAKGRVHHEDTKATRRREEDQEGSRHR